MYCVFTIITITDSGLQLCISILIILTMNYLFCLRNKLRIFAKNFIRPEGLQMLLALTIEA